MREALLNIDIPELTLFRKGKVRNVYDMGDKLLFVVSDRISAFDVVMPNGIPGKGRILNNISKFWFDLTRDIISNHVISADIDEIVKMEKVLKKYKKTLEGRSMLVKKADPIPVECIVRGYVAGSGWKDYRKTGKICGIDLPNGLKESSKLKEPIFTPSTKADEGHDENISLEKAKEIAGEKTVDEIKDKSVEIYVKARDYADTRGIIIADTKFEFGTVDGKIILMDEILTPDSSRFWPKAEYAEGRPQKSFDKQFVRDYLEALVWDKTPPAPALPDKIVAKTLEKYLEVYKVLTGSELVTGE
ncbi:MAG: phosphoribosylaminoimidazolesuccinocarboxamide synthase [Candidatus Omnitrophica bacterium]|nr:phosphoribosylaminoimidazolesuccinocarboxamide synthase [Candidatus Omnitrophota bacterium]